MSHADSAAFRWARQASIAVGPASPTGIPAAARQRGGDPAAGLRSSPTRAGSCAAIISCASWGARCCGSTTGCARGRS